MTAGVFRSMWECSCGVWENFAQLHGGLGASGSTWKHWRGLTVSLGGLCMASGPNYIFLIYLCWSGCLFCLSIDHWKIYLSIPSKFLFCAELCGLVLYNTILWITIRILWQDCTKCWFELPSSISDSQSWSHLWGVYFKVNVFSIISTSCWCFCLAKHCLFLLHNQIHGFALHPNNITIVL
jgi:hypothetical protein